MFEVTGLCLSTLGLFIAFCFFFSGLSWRKHENGGMLLFFAGCVLLIVFSLASSSGLKDGSPVNQISPGIYKVGFVYEVGGNVNIGIEKEGKETEVKVEHLYLYQFPLADFEGPIGSRIPPNVKKLTVYKLTTGEGTFNRYKLE